MKRTQSLSRRPNKQPERRERTGQKGKSQRPRSNVFLPSFLPVSWIVKKPKKQQNKRAATSRALHHCQTRDRDSTPLHDLYCTVQYLFVHPHLNLYRSLSVSTGDATNRLKKRFISFDKTLFGWGRRKRQKKKNQDVLASGRARWWW